MKSIFTSVMVMVSVAVGFSQAPELINYQAIVRDVGGMSVANQVVGIKVSILQGSVSGPAVFSETHTPTTNAYGLVNLQIGNGVNFGPQLNTIDWGADTYFVMIEIDPDGGTTYEISSTAQLVSVPYALHAKTVEQNDDADADPLNETNTGAVLNGTDLEITDAGGTLVTDLSSLVDDADADPSNEIQTLSKVGNIITLSNGGGAVTDDVNDADASPTNELNTGIALSGSTLSVTDAGGSQSVNLAPLIVDGSTTNELNTSATLVGNTLNITDAGGTLSVNLSSLVNDADASTSNELNTSANLSGTTLNITDAGGTLSVNLSSLVNDADASASNELNTSATLVGNTLNITDAGGTLSVNLSSLVNDADASTSNELNTGANLVGTTLNITDAGGTIGVDLSSLEDDADADPTNEIQTLSLVGSDLTISGGNTITLGGGTDSQTLSLVGDDLTILNGNTVTLDGDPSNEIQTLSLVGSDLTISGGNTVTLGGGTDSQTLTLVGSDLSISNGNTVTLPSGGTDSQTLTIVGSDLTISGGNTVTLPGGVDTDDQTLTLVGADLTIADGNTVTLPVQTHFVGEHFGGGIIVFVDSTGQHGLICATADLPGTYAFENLPNSTTILGASFTDGEANTAAMIAVPGDYPAAEACVAYNGGGFTDWYLPSVFELELLMQSNYVLGSSALFTTGATYYWSSTEPAASLGVNAYRGLHGGTFAISSTSESTALAVRPVRYF